MTTPELLQSAYAGSRVPPALAAQPAPTPTPAQPMLVIPGAVDAAAQQGQQAPPPPPAEFEPKLVNVGGEEVFDFTTGRKNIKFKIDDDIFEATRELPGLAGIEVAAYANQLDQSNGMDPDAIKELVTKIYRLVLLPASAELLLNRLADQTNPVGVETMTNVMQWLIGRYGLRPTVPSGSSADGSSNPETGTS